LKKEDVVFRSFRNSYVTQPTTRNNNVSSSNSITVNDLQRLHEEWLGLVKQYEENKNFTNDLWNYFVKSEVFPDFPEDYHQFDRYEIFEKVLPEWAKIKVNSDVFANTITNVINQYYNHHKQILLTKTYDALNGKIDFTNNSIKNMKSDAIEKSPLKELNNLFDKFNFNYQFTEIDFENLSQTSTPSIFLQRVGGTYKFTTNQQNFSNLSDGEQSIIMLAIASYNFVHGANNNTKVLLLDEYDAVLNPSLINIFFGVLKNFFIDKDVQVILVTHSPATISLAPDDYTTFYQISHKNDESPEIREVDKSEYAEMKVALSDYYLKSEFEKMLKEKLEEYNKPMLLVEDAYSQIYKIAYLRLNKIDFEKNTIDSVFNERSYFKIIDNLTSGGVFGALNCDNMDMFDSKNIIGLFDYDNEGVEKFHKLQKHNKTYGDIQGDLVSGLYIQHKLQKNIFALLLSIPDRLKDKTNQNIWNSDATYTHNHVEIETLLPENILIQSGKCWQDTITKVWKVKDDKKCDFWKDLIKLDESAFIDFKSLFTTVNNIFNITNKNEN
jgi:ABC-type branched-subunit amino acid transport system ATPase component